MKQRQIKEDENGQSIVEAAFVIPLLIVILCGIIDFGWIFFNQLTLNNCSRHGARYAIVNSDNTNLLAAVTSEVKFVGGFEDTQNLTVALDRVNNTDIKVTVTKTVDVLTPISGIFTSDQKVMLTSSSVMKLE